MSMQHRLPDQVVRADPWTLFCAECSQKMRVMTATPAEGGRETRTYECVCGHRERDQRGPSSTGRRDHAAGSLRRRHPRGHPGEDGLTLGVFRHGESAVCLGEKCLRVEFGFWFLGHDRIPVCAPAFDYHRTGSATARPAVGHTRRATSAIEIKLRGARNDLYRSRTKWKRRPD
jgi:hypothetical protein